jgi:hypothetical protein
MRDFERCFDVSCHFTTLFFSGILALNWIDSNRNYKKLIIGSALLNGVIMIGVLF